MKGEVRSIPGSCRRGCSFTFMHDNTMKDKFSLMREMQEELFHRDGRGWFKVISRSMYPLIEVNDKVLVKKSAIHEVRTGDIVLFRTEELFVAHRIINIMKKAGSTLILQKGDANNYASLICPESIVGKVTTIEKKGKIIELETVRGKCINLLPVIKNCYFYKNLGYHEQGEEKVKRNKYLVYIKGLYWVLNKSFVFCNRIILRILLHCFMYIFLFTQIRQ